VFLIAFEISFIGKESTDQKIEEFGEAKSLLRDLGLRTVMGFVSVSAISIPVFSSDVTDLQPGRQVIKKIIMTPHANLRLFKRFNIVKRMNELIEVSSPNPTEGILLPSRRVEYGDKDKAAF